MEKGKTMRLIDADRLLQGYEDHDFIDTHVVWNAPTVEAIPIEWMLNEWDSKEWEDVGYQVMRRIIADWAERREE